LIRKTPVALFTYNRPQHTQRILDALSKCRRIDECDFYFFSDGPREGANRNLVDATRILLKERADEFSANIVIRNENYGLAKSIVSGVTELCSRYGCVIVLEDDLVVAADFLHYMLEALDRYQNDERVMQVGGFTVSSPTNIINDVFLLPVTSTWGWATWQRAWQHFSWQPIGLTEARSDPEWVRLFDLNGTCAFSSMLADRLAGRNDSWGILWWYAVSRCRGLVCYPRDSLVWNGGFDGSGVHCGDTGFSGQEAISELTDVGFPAIPVFPSRIEYKALHLTQLEDFFRPESNDPLQKMPVNGIQWKLKNLAKIAARKIYNAFH